MARRKMRSTALAIAGLWCRKGRRRFGTESTHWRNGKRRQDMIDEMGGGLDHTAGITRRTCSPAPAGERHQKVVATPGAPCSCESMSENATAQIGPEVALDPRGDAVPHGVRLGGLCEERLEVVLDQRIERRQGRTAPSVDRPTVWCGGPKGRP